MYLLKRGWNTGFCVTFNNYHKSHLSWYVLVRLILDKVRFLSSSWNMKEGWMVKLTPPPYLEKATLKNPNLIRVNNLLDITSSFDFSVFSPLSTRHFAKVYHLHSCCCKRYWFLVIRSLSCEVVRLFSKFSVFFSSILRTKLRSLNRFRVNFCTNQLGLVQSLWNSDFILESIMTKLNQNKKSKPPDWPETVWQVCFTLEMNK